MEATFLSGPTWWSLGRCCTICRQISNMITTLHYQSNDFTLIKSMQIYMQYFSYHIIIDAPHDTSTPSIYALESLQSHMNASIFGESFHMLVSSLAFYMPVYNIALKISGYKPVDKSTFVSFVKKGTYIHIYIPGYIIYIYIYAFVCFH
jgi:hypothetical protein